MGLADRDAMRRTAPLRSVPASAPPEPSAGLTLLMIILFVGVTYGAYTAWRWWQPPRSTAPVPLPTAPAEPPLQPSVRMSPSQQPSSRPTSVINGDGGFRPDEGQHAVPAERAVRITKCVANGVTSYSDGECPPQAARSTITLDRRQNVADGLPPAARAFAPPPPQTQAPAAYAAPPVVDPNVSKKAVCLALEEEIKTIDALARQPLPAWEQDRLAARRKAARDEQFRIRC